MMIEVVEWRPSLLVWLVTRLPATCIDKPANPATSARQLGRSCRRRIVSFGGVVGQAFVGMGLVGDGPCGPAHPPRRYVGVGRMDTLPIGHQLIIHACGDLHFVEETDQREAVEMIEARILVVWVTIDSTDTLWLPARYWSSTSDRPRLLACSAIHSSALARGGGVSPAGRRRSDSASAQQADAHSPHPTHRAWSTTQTPSGRETAAK